MTRPNPARARAFPSAKWFDSQQHPSRIPDRQFGEHPPRIPLGTEWAAPRRDTRAVSSNAGRAGKTEK